MKKKVLVVDDSEVARKFVLDILKKGPYTTLEPRDGNEALKLLAAHPDTSVIFTDINMPGLNGLEMLERIKDDPVLRHIPVCVLTTESSPDSLARAKALGVNAFLVKPVKVEQLDLVMKSLAR